MNRIARGMLLLGIAGGAATPAAAQIGEVHLGAVATYGTGDVYGPGAGLLLGVAAGRLTYLGLRWTTFQGTTTTFKPQGATVEVLSRTSTYAADLGLMIPAGRLDIMPGLALGLVHYTQRSRPASGGESTTHADEFLVMPGIAVEVHVARFALIPEIQYCLSGDPELPLTVSHGGVLASLRLVIPFEVGRVKR